MRTTGWKLVGTLILALAITGTPKALAAGPVVHTVLEGRASDGTGNTALLLMGKSLKSVASVHLEPPVGGDATLPQVELGLQARIGSGFAVYADSAGLLLPGEYELRLVLKNGTRQDVGRVKLAAGNVVPGTFIPDASFSAYADLLQEGRIGTNPSQVSPGNHRHDGDYSETTHNHDGEYPKKSDLSTDDGQPDQATDPVHWSRIRGMPESLKDGDDVGTAGEGLALTGTTFSVVFAGPGSALSASRSDHTHDGQYAGSSHDHDNRYFTETEVSAAGTLNATGNPVDWTKLKGVPGGFADGVDDVGDYTAGAGLLLSSGQFSLDWGGTGSATKPSRSDHNHDTAYSGATHDHDGRYYPQTDLNSVGAINSSTNPVDWTRLKGVPAGLADGADDDTTYGAGTGLSLSSGLFSVLFGGTGSASTSARSDHAHDANYAAVVHEHDTRYYTQTQLNATTGTLNASTNPMDWSQLKSVPSGFADGVDDNTTYLAGAGVSLSSGSFSVAFSGNGSSDSAARGDHEHDSRYYTQTQLGSTGGTLNASGNPVDWSRLKGVPAGFADGTDDGVTFAGSGSASTAARSDHDHDTNYLKLTGGSVSGRVTVTGASNTVGDVSVLRIVDTQTSNQNAAVRATAKSETGNLCFLGAGVVGSTTGGPGNMGVYGYDVGTSSASFGVRGFSASSQGTGVYGQANSTSGTTFGVYGLASTSATSVGVYGTGRTGVKGDGAPGVHGISNSSSGAALQGDAGGSAGIGVRGSATSGTGTTYGSYGASASTSGTGAYGEATATTGTTYGVYGKANGTSGYAGYFTNVGAGLYAESTNTTGATIAIQGKNASTSGYGGWFENTKTSGTTYGLYAKSASNSGYALFAENTATTGTGHGLYGKTASSGGAGVTGDNTSSGTGIFAQAAASGNALVANLTSSNTPSTSANNLAVFQTNGTNQARIDNSGRGLFNGGTATSGADFAESVAVNEPKIAFEPGDVLAIDPDGTRRFALSREAESTLVAGVYSTKPGILATVHEVAGDGAALREEVPLAVVGIVPTKVCDEGGPIRAGDLLVTASLPGHARKASSHPAPGTVLGKALGVLREGRGVVEVLLMAR